MQVRLQFALRQRRFQELQPTASSDCSASSVPLALPSVSEALNEEIFFLWDCWLPVGLMRFSASSLSGSFQTCMKSVHLSGWKCRKSRNAFKEASCEPQLCFSGQFILHLLFLFLVHPISAATNLIPNVRHQSRSVIQLLTDPSAAPV